MGKEIDAKDCNCGFLLLKKKNWQNARFTLKQKGWGLNLSVGLTLSVRISTVDSPNIVTNFNCFLDYIMDIPVPICLDGLKKML